MSDGTLPPVVSVLTANADGFLEAYGVSEEAAKSFADTVETTSAQVAASTATLTANTEASVAAAGLTWDAAAQRYRTTAGQFASADEVAAVGATTAADTMGLKWDETAQRYRNAAGQFATSEELAAAGAEGMATRTVAADEKAASSKESLGMSASKVGGIITAALVGISAVSVKAASDFDAAMERIHTQAGVPQAQIAELSKEVLDLASKVGESPDSLASALYWVESNFGSMGITGQKAMALVTDAAKLARVGNASLDDTTTALNATFASGIAGVKNYNQAVGALNAIVGSGEMTMEQFNDSMSTGVLAQMKAYGLTIADVGAGIATLGDQNIRGAKAATDLRMAVQAMAVPMTSAEGYLQSIGMSYTQMSTDMQKGGVIPALEDLRTHLEAAGVTGNQVGQALTTIFGKKAGNGAAVLYENLDRMKTKYDAIDAASNNFGGDWAKTADTSKQKMADLKAGADALAIEYGNMLIPKLEAVLTTVESVCVWLDHHRTAAVALAVVVGGVLTTAMAAFMGTMAAKAWATAAGGVEGLINGFKMLLPVLGEVDAEADANPVGAIILAIAALSAGIYELVTHWHQVTKAVEDFITQHKALAVIIGIVLAPITEVVGAVIGVVEIVKHWGEITQWFSGIWSDTWGAITSSFDDVVSFFEQLPGKVVNAFESLGKDLLNVGTGAMRSLLQGVTSAANSVWSFFSSLPGRILSELKALPDQLATVAGDAIGAMVVALLTYAVSVWDFWTKLVPRAISYLGNLGAELATWAGQAILSLVSAVTVAATAVWTFFTNLPGNIVHLVGDVTHLLTKAGTDIIDGLESAIVTAAVAVWKFFTDLPGTVVHDTGDLSRTLTKAGTDLVTGLWSAITSTAGAMWNFFTGLPGEIVHAIGDLSHTLYDAGADLLRGFINGIESMASTLVSSIENTITDHLPGFVKSALGIHSPSTVFADIGANVMAGLAQGITANGRGPLEALAAITGQLGLGSTGENGPEATVSARPTLILLEEPHEPACLLAA